MLRGMKSLARIAVLLIAALIFVGFRTPHAGAQNLAKRLILKDGSYQLAAKYEINGDRVRYYRAERGEWEEIPKILNDREATDKYEQGRLQGAPSPEAVQLDKELEAEQKAEEARSPHVAPGLRLPEEGGVFLLDTFQNQPQLDELQQSGGELNKNTKSNILRAAINPLASSKQTIELDGVRVKIVRAEIKNGKRIAGAIKIAPYGKVKADERFVAATVQELGGGWVKLSPKEPLASGEYAVAEMLGKEGINLYVWDFGVNPSAPANAFAWKPDAKEAQKKPDQPEELKKREKQ